MWAHFCSKKQSPGKNFTIFTGKHLCWSLFNKVIGLRPATLLKKRLQRRCFPVNFVKFLQAPFLYRTHPVAASVLAFSGAGRGQKARCGY